MRGGGSQTTGCRWTGVTVSKQQLEEAAARVEAAGLAARITLLFCDYRELPGVYDKVPPCWLSLSQVGGVQGAMIISAPGLHDGVPACLVNAH